MVSFRKLLFGSSPRLQKTNLLSQGQQDLLDFILQQAQGAGVNEDFFNQNFVNPALRQFENRIAPGIQQKFIGQGNIRGGSDLNNALLRAGADVQGNLNQQRAQLLENALNRQLQRQQLALGVKPFGFTENPGSSGIIPSLVKGALIGGTSSLGEGFGGLFGQRQGFLR